MNKFPHNYQDLRQEKMWKRIELYFLCIIEGIWICQCPSSLSKSYWKQTELGSIIELYGYEIWSCIFLPYCWSCRVGLDCTSHTVPTIKRGEWRKYCALAFIPWLLSCCYLFTIHSSHLYWLFWVFQMPMDRYLQRSEWWFVLYRTFYI